MVSVHVPVPRRTSIVLWRLADLASLGLSCVVRRDNHRRLVVKVSVPLVSHMLRLVDEVPRGVAHVKVSRIVSVFTHDAG